MQYRRLGDSDLQVSILSFGTGTFGGTGPLFGAWGDSGVAEATRLVDVCIEAGVNLFDTADTYSRGASEIILGKAIKRRRDSVILATKTGLPMGEDGSDRGASRDRLIRAVEASLVRLETDYIDLLQLHAFDAHTAHDEVLRTIEHLIAAGKIRYAGISNYPAWQAMKALDAADKGAGPRFVCQQVYYSLIGRDYEAELMPLAADQDLPALVWSPLGWGRLTGKLRRGMEMPATSRLHSTADFGPPVDEERLYRVIEMLAAIAEETGRTIPQVALNWLCNRPTVASVIIGARNEEQLRDNLGAVGWTLSEAQISRLDEVSATTAPYPHFLYRGGGFAKLNPPII